jgi:hypothetical protein
VSSCIAVSPSSSREASDTLLRFAVRGSFMVGDGRGREGSEGCAPRVPKLDDIAGLKLAKFVVE